MGPPPAKGPVPLVLVVGCGCGNVVVDRPAAAEAYELLGRTGGEPQPLKGGGGTVFDPELCVLARAIAAVC